MSLLMTRKADAMRMAPPPDDGSSPWRQGTPHDSLNRLTPLLGTFVLKESSENEPNFVQTSLAPKHAGLMKLLSTETVNASSFSFPCLSLVTEDHTGVQGLDQNEVQAKAALSMARSLRISPNQKKAGNAPDEPKSISKSAAKCHTATPALALEDVPTAMLDNLVASFALLVDARLRAYTTVLARHGVSLAAGSEAEQEAISAVARKLEHLADIGSLISVDNMVTNFHPQSKKGVSRRVDNGCVDEVMMPLVMSAVLDISVPFENEGHERVTFPLQAAGAIVGSSDKGSTLLKSVRMELNTQQLMSAMMLKAAKVSSIALGHVNDSTCRHVAAAMLSLKTVLPDKPTALSGNRILPVVSPDQISVLPLKPPTPLDLDEEDGDDDDGPELTPERCASIVDDCIGGIGEDSLMLSPPTKKMRLEDSPAVPPAIL